MGLVGAAPLGEPGDSPEMDGGIEQNPAYGTAPAFMYGGYGGHESTLTLTHTLTGTRPVLDFVVFCFLVHGLGES